MILKNINIDVENKKIIVNNGDLKKVLHQLHNMFGDEFMDSFDIEVEAKESTKLLEEVSDLKDEIIALKAAKDTSNEEKAIVFKIGFTGNTEDLIIGKLYTLPFPANTIELEFLGLSRLDELPIFKLVKDDGDHYNSTRDLIESATIYSKDDFNFVGSFYGPLYIIKQLDDNLIDYPNPYLNNVIIRGSEELYISGGDLISVTVSDDTIHIELYLDFYNTHHRFLQSLKIGTSGMDVVIGDENFFFTNCKLIKTTSITNANRYSEVLIIKGDSLKTPAYTSIVLIKGDETVALNSSDIQEVTKGMDSSFSTDTSLSVLSNAHSINIKLHPLEDKLNSALLLMLNISDYYGKLNRIDSLVFTEYSKTGVFISKTVFHNGRIMNLEMSIDNEIEIQIDFDYYSTEF